MATDRTKQRGFRLIFGLGFLAALALLALACAPAAQPPAAPEATAVPGAPEATAAPEATPEVAAVGYVAPEEGRYIEKAGLRLFLPQGYEFGGPTIPPDPRTPRYGGTFVHAQPGDPPSIDPYHTATANMTRPMGVVYERLIQTPVGPGLDSFDDVRIPGLAESWKVSDDFLTYTFYLRKGVKWHNLPPVNGREVDAEDVKFTWDLYRSPGSAQGAFFVDVDRTEVVDKYTAVLHMKRVSPGILSNLSDHGRGYILPRESATINRRLTAIGTGPFMVEKDYEYKVGVTARRNPDYWLTDTVKGGEGNRLPYMDRVRMAIIIDPSAQIAAFRSGKLDFAIGFVGPEGVRALLKSNPTTLVQERPASPYGVGSTAFRLDKAPWNDVRVRRAMSLAIDYDTFSQSLYQVPFNGTSGVAGAWYGQMLNTVEVLAKDCGCPWYSYNPTLAKQLLAEAGYPNGFTTTFEYHAYGQSWTEDFETQAGYWGKIGVNVGIRNLDLTVFRPQMDRGAWENLGMYFLFPAPSSIYGSVPHLVPGHLLNPVYGWINDPKITAWVKEFEASYRDLDKQKDLVRQIRAHFLDQVYTIPRALGRGYSLFSPRLRNYQPVNTPLISEIARPVITAWIDEDWSFAK